VNRQQSVVLVSELCEYFARHQPCDDREAQSIAEFIAVSPSLVAPFDEHSDTTHVTASAIVVGPRGVVLHLHKRLGVWLQPGGHIDAGEGPADAALRETYEETGLQGTHSDGGPRLFHLDVHPGPHGHRHLDLRYLVHGPDIDPHPLEDESQDAAWFAWDEAMAMADVGLRGALGVARTISGGWFIG
jgi:8-oxo-dGTP pyrophosphatase MutT (NUDIX family)